MPLMARIIVPAAEELLDKEISVLDHGFVRLVDYMGGDARIVQAARVSYGEGTKTVREDGALIDYLLRNRHTSPFEQVIFTFHVKMPIFVARQWIRHRTARLNEISGRYSVMRDEFYVPNPNEVRKQSKLNRQGGDAAEVPAELREHVALASATVVDRSSVVTTHMAEVVRVHAAELLGREDVKMLVDMVRQSNPVVIEELTPTPLSLGEIQRALQSLLAERVCIRDLVRIFEAMSMRAKASTDPDGLTEAARSALGPAIAASHAVDGRLSVVTFDPLLEQRLLENLRITEAGAALMIDPMVAEAVATEVATTAARAEAAGDPPVLVCAQPLRLPVRRLLEQIAPRIPVLSYAELGGQLTLVTSGVVNVSQISAA